MSQYSGQAAVETPESHEELEPRPFRMNGY